MKRVAVIHDGFQDGTLHEALAEIPEYEFTLFENRHSLWTDLKRARIHWDLVLQLCYDLHVCAMLDVLGLSYTGSGVATMAMTADRQAQSIVAKQLGIPTQPVQGTTALSVSILGNPPDDFVVLPITGKNESVTKLIIESSKRLHARFQMRDYGLFHWSLNPSGEPLFLEAAASYGHPAEALSLTGMSYRNLLEAILTAASRRYSID